MLAIMNDYYVGAESGETARMIEVAPEMIEAGLDAFLDLVVIGEATDLKELCDYLPEVFRAMILANSRDRHVTLGRRLYDF